MPRILLTNDDGIAASGLLALESALSELGETYVAAPLAEQSGKSRAITLRRPLRYREVAPRRWGIEGTPSDCMILALSLILDFRPDLILSGINHGPNLGENIFHSGTVAGAAEGAKYGIPSIAVSVSERENLDFSPAAQFALKLSRRVLERGLPAGVALNVNVPHPGYNGVRVTRQCPKISRNVMVEGSDPRGRPYYWMHEEVPVADAEDGTDYAAVREGKVSITPLRFDHTAEAEMGTLAEWFAEGV